MRRLILILTFFTFGCEKFELQSYTPLNLNGRWDVVKIKVVIDKVNFDSHVIVLSENEAAVTNFYVKEIINNQTLLLGQDYNMTSVDRRFDINKTTWDFQNVQLRIYENNQNVVYDDYIMVNFPCTYCTKQTIMEWDYMGNKTRYTFSIDTYGAMPSNELILTSQSFYTDIKLGSNTYDKAIESHLEVTLHRK
jgi:hypothetical protein